MSRFSHQAVQSVVGIVSLGIACMNVADLVVSIGEGRWFASAIDAFGAIFFGGSALLNLDEVSRRGTNRS